MSPRRLPLSLLAALACACARPPVPGIEELADALAAFGSRDYPAASAAAEAAAAEGQPAAECLLGILLEEGLGGRRDPAGAARWYERAAGRKYPEAEYRLGRLYERGLGVRRDLREALSLYDRAAERGFIEAQYAAARMRLGRGGKAARLAESMLRQPAKLGHAPSRMALGRLRERGGDLRTALFWYRLAEARGAPEAREAARRVAGRLVPRRAAGAERAAAHYPHQ